MIAQLERLKKFLKPAERVDWDAVFTADLPRLYNYFRFHGVEDGTAEDLAAGVFEKAWRARDAYRSEKSAVSTWLLAIARNTLRDYFRAAPVEQPLENLEDLPAQVSSGANPQESAEKADEHERLRRLLLRLPDRERELVALKYGAEMTNRAIARQTGLSESNVGTILSRVVASLRARMEEER